MRHRAAGHAGTSVGEKVDDADAAKVPERMVHPCRPVLELAFDAFVLAGPSGRSGIGTYERQLLGGLAGCDDVTVHALAPDGVSLPDGIVRHRARRTAPGRFARIENDVRLPLDLRRLPGDVFHSPAPYAPRRRVTRPWAQTLFDVIPLVVDDPALTESKRRLEACIPAYRTADAVIAISRHTADEGVRVMGLDPSRIHVVPLAVDPAFRPPPDAPDHDNREHDPYVLVVSAFDPRKGFREAFEVIGALADAGLPHRLKVAGNLPSWVRPVVEKLRADASHPERVEILGFVDDLVPLYWNAAATIVTSRYEGFGLPALEAMASGSPLVAFANTSLPEVVGDGGVLVPDGDVAGFASALIAVLADESRRTDLVEAGLARAADFTLDAMVEGHVDVYRSVLR